MIDIPSLLAWVYARLLHMYPREFRDEFAEEMKTAFADAIQDAEQAGPLTLLRLCWRELCEMPVNSAREHWTRFQRGSVKMSTPTPLSVRPLSWPETLIGLFPFFLFGPLAVWLAYPYPYPRDSLSAWFVGIWVPLYLLCALFGLVVGWITGWRRWSFPYLGLGIYAVGGLILSAINALMWRFASSLKQDLSWPELVLLPIAGFALILCAFTLLLLVAFLLARVVVRFRMLYLRIRQDWTLLSFGLSIGATIAMGVEHEEDPAMTILVILPSLTVFCSALTYLRSTSRIGRVGSLLVGLALAVALSLLRHGWFIVYAAILIPIIFLPALFELRSLQNEPVMAE